MQHTPETATNSKVRNCTFSLPNQSSHKIWQHPKEGEVPERQAACGGVASYHSDICRPSVLQEPWSVDLQDREFLGCLAYRVNRSGQNMWASKLAALHQGNTCSFSPPLPEPPAAGEAAADLAMTEDLSACCAFTSVRGVKAALIACLYMTSCSL